VIVAEIYRSRGLSLLLTIQGEIFDELPTL
jgi:hypothetical protein